MVKLYQPPPVWGLPNMSPFCAKLETYLRMAKIDYQVINGNPMSAPKRKIPYAEVDGRVMGDSNLIIQHLKKTKGDLLDQHLTESERATANAFLRMTEEHFYFAGAYLRWTDPQSLAEVRKVFMTLLPPVIGPLIFKKIYKNFKQLIYAQGMGRHTRDEIVEFARNDLKSISVFLGDKPYFMGDKPTSLDATMYGFLIQQLWVPWESSITEYAKSLPNLEAFCQRMKQQYWS